MAGQDTLIDVTKRPPGPSGLPVIGTLLEFTRGDPIAALLRWSREYGPISEFSIGPWRLWLLNDPGAIRHVLQDRYPNYPKSLNYRELAHVLGDGLLTSEGAFWLKQRKLVQPGFHARHDETYLGAIAGAIETVLGDWARGPATIDVAHEMMRLALLAVGRALFGSDLSGEANALAAALKTLLFFAEKRMSSLVRLPYSWPLPRHVTAWRATGVLDRVVYGIIRGRRERGELGSDLLGALLRARDDDSRAMTDEQVRNEVLTLLVAGHETTANALAWTWFLLATHPEIEEKLAAEVAPLEGPLTLSLLEGLRWPKLIVQEALRLYPPAWWIERQAAERDELLGYPVEPGTFMVVSPYTIHRSATYWEEPDAFRPERFDGPDTRPRGVYIPFGMGPRACVGSGFAMLEAQAAVVEVARRFKLSLVPGHEVRAESLITLRPRGGIKMRVERRQLPVAP
jgi:cytochrome P450